MSRGYPPEWIDAHWTTRFTAELLAEQLSQRAWVNELAVKYGIVRRTESLTGEELAEQQKMLAWKMHRVFLTTTPLPGLYMDFEGNWHRTDPV